MYIYIYYFLFLYVYGRVALWGVAPACGKCGRDRLDTLGGGGNLIEFQLNRPHQRFPAIRPSGCLSFICRSSYPSARPPVCPSVPSPYSANKTNDSPYLDLFWYISLFTCLSVVVCL